MNQLPSTGEEDESIYPTHPESARHCVYLGTAALHGAALVFVMLTMRLRFELEAQAQLYREGILMGCTVILFIPIYLELARLLG